MVKMLPVLMVGVLTWMCAFVRTHSTAYRCLLVHVHYISELISLKGKVEMFSEKAKPGDFVAKRSAP